MTKDTANGDRYFGGTVPPSHAALPSSDRPAARESEFEHIPDPGPSRMFRVSLSCDNTQNRELFDRWYVQPLSMLEDLPEGIGAFIALATACFLYERYAIAVLVTAGLTAGPKELKKRLSEDFGLDSRTADNFWDVIRDGLAHQGMPKQKDRGKPLPRWRLHGDFPRAIGIAADGELRVQPWLFMKRVLELWGDNLDLLDKSDAFPWARVVR